MGVNGKKLRSPIPWFGGKGPHVHRIVPLLPKMHTYVEPFGGAANILLNRAPAPVEVYNDVDGRLVNLFRVLRDPEQAAELKRLVDLTLHSRQEFSRPMTGRTWTAWRGRSRFTLSCDRGFRASPTAGPDGHSVLQNRGAG